MKSAGFVMVIMSGYAAISLGILKIFWRQFGVHFYSSGVAHAPQAELLFDIALIFFMILSGLCLVIFRVVIPALFSIIAAFFIEFLLLHDDLHHLWQVAFAVSAIVGQIITLMVYTIGFTDLGKGYARRQPVCPSTGRPT